MKKYQEPEIKVTEFHAEAILLNSGVLDGSGIGIGDDEEWE